MPISEVFMEDCMIGMARYPDKYFNLAIVDPPYGLNAPNMNMGYGAKCMNGYTPTAVKLKERYHGRGKLKERAFNKLNMNWDTKPDPIYFTELFRISANQIIWGGNYFGLPATRCIICWDKMQPWENFSQWEMAWTSYDKPASIFKRRNTGGDNYEKKIHPTQKPVALYKWILNRYAEPGHKILDTHMGSQSSRIAAYQMGFDYWGWEIDTEYFESGNKRFKEQTAQLNLL